MDQQTIQTQSTQSRFVQFSTQEENLFFQGVLDIEPKELAQKMNLVTLVDVRQREEFSGELGRIPGSQLIVLDELPQALGNLDHNLTYVFICRSGTRSARAAEFARAQGYDSVYNLKGGMLLWHELKLPIES